MNSKLNGQITVELQAHYTYLRMSHKFNERTSYYPKVAAYFRAKADEEMQHAERFIQYQNQRGGKTSSSNIAGQINDVPVCNTVTTLRSAFLCAQSLEIFVTGKLTELARDAMNVVADGDATSVNDNELLKGQAVIITTGYGKKSLQEYLNGSSTPITTVEYIELAEMITHEFLGHQIEDTKEIANYLETLEKFHLSGSTGTTEVENLASYLFDKNL